ncbi:hypothetical protein DICPUDRAFT_80870 [Dictyostelium purpureum]|uniref:Uncharacterized protein n=1 Tax=Dictyostelium purpureum TaxID=5786 RepID=F0ZRS9_DICPU|nr:uncharacterized protein DICPUDRAFT_80870 [Dictyostelium purpureum]EGC33372.1 hypothetical protein DICPUDRAFT_80870 [Dictyostelium purpureum]|eukprot:XP_003290123.1 hypothetical protein DICPUDRAFT_80870 [Dictyostelium purpureum]
MQFNIREQPQPQQQQYSTSEHQDDNTNYIKNLNNPSSMRFVLRTTDSSPYKIDHDLSNGSSDGRNSTEKDDRHPIYNLTSMSKNDNYENNSNTNTPNNNGNNNHNNNNSNSKNIKKDSINDRTSDQNEIIKYLDEKLEQMEKENSFFTSTMEYNYHNNQINYQNYNGNNNSDINNKGLNFNSYFNRNQNNNSNNNNSDFNSDHNNDIKHSSSSPSYQKAQVQRTTQNQTAPPPRNQNNHQSTQSPGINNLRNNINTNNLNVNKINKNKIIDNNLSFVMDSIKFEIQELDKVLYWMLTYKPSNEKEINNLREQIFLKSQQIEKLNETKYLIFNQ